MTAVFGLLTALWLGILTSISPCPLASNVTAVAFLSNKFDSRLRVLLNGLLYTLGRSLTYFVLSSLILGGLFSIPSVSLFLQQYVAKLLGPVLVLVGMVLLGLLPFPSLGKFLGNMSAKLPRRGYVGAFFMGAFFALAFCPTSAAIYFGALLPLAIGSRSTIGMPVLYGIGTGLPVTAFAILIAFGFEGVKRVLSNVARFEYWVRLCTGGLFVIAGLYYILAHIFGVI